MSGLYATLTPILDPNFQPITLEDHWGLHTQTLTPTLGHMVFFRAT